MSLLGGLGAAIGGLLGFAGQESANDAQAALLERQIEWQKEVLQNKVQWNVEDMKAAGLNPVLSVMSGGAASGSAPSVSAPQVQNPAQAASNSAMAVSQIVNQAKAMANDSLRADSEVQVNNARSAQLESEQRKNDSLVESGLFGAQTAAQQSSAAQAYQQIEYLKSAQSKIGQEIKESTARIDVMRQEVVNMSAQVDYLRQQGAESKSRQALYAAESALRHKQAELTELEKSTEVLRAENWEVANELERLKVPEAENKAAFQQKSGNRFMLRNVPGFGKYLNWR